MKTSKTSSSNKKEQVEIVLDKDCILDLNIYTNKDSMNRYLTTEMFEDHPDNNRINNKTSPYSLFNSEHIVREDGSMLYSMRRLFLDNEDTTGYKCAIECFGNWEHFKRCLKNSIINIEFSKWVEELEAREYALVKAAYIQEIKNDGRNKIQACKGITTLNDQDPNSHTNREKMALARKTISVKNDNKNENVLSDDDKIKMMEDYKRMNK